MRSTFLPAGRALLAAAVASVSACAAPAPTTAVAMATASTSPATVPSPSPAAPSAAPTSETPSGSPDLAPAVEVNPTYGAATLAGRPAAGWTMTFVDALTGETLPIKASLDAASTDRSVYTADAKTDAEGEFQFLPMNLADGDVVRVVMTAPDEKQSVTALMTIGGHGDYRLAHSTSLDVNEVSTALETLQRGPLAGLRLLERAEARHQAAKLSAAAEALETMLHEAFEAGGFDSTALFLMGHSDDDRQAAMLRVLEKAKATELAAGVVADAVAAMGTKLPANAGTLSGARLFGTLLTLRSEAGGFVIVDASGKSWKASETSAAAIKAAAQQPPRASGGGSSGSSGPAMATFSLSFVGRIGDQAVTVSGESPQVSDATYTAFGQDAQKIRPRDFRFYVHDVELLDGNGDATPLQLSAGTWQHENLALVDLESSATTETNATITGKAARGTYTGVRFKLGVPASLNHLQSVEAETNGAPHDILLSDGLGAGMMWSWLGGRKYVKFEFAVQHTNTEGALTEQMFLFHLGGQEATNVTKPEGPAYDGFDPGQTVLQKPNVATISLTELNPATDSIAVDLGAFFENVLVDGGGSYMPTRVMSMPMPMLRLLQMGPTNEPDVLMKNLGLAGGAAQTLFRKDTVD